MLLSIDKSTHLTEKKTGSRLQAMGLDERGLQDILFKTLDRLFPDDELILLMQSRRWQEEPDLMAVDKHGHLYIFEMKAWESHPSNLLQVLRYAQLYGPSKYADLDNWYKKATNSSQSLKVAHAAKFGTDLAEQAFNKKQIFVVITNGLDFKTREAIQYWRSCSLDVRPWVYRVYEGHPNEILLEMSAFRVEDNPYEDIAEGYYILNTNISNDQTDHDDILKNHKAAAYFDPWKYKIERLAKGDIVYLYQSRVGIVAFGKADGKLVKASYQGNPAHPDEEYYMKLLDFQNVKPPMTAADIKRITGVDYVFMQTMFGLDATAGKAIRKFIVDNGRISG
ncbi:MAG: hypothetical protein KBG01_06905 [Syntrophobacterales bacterium]|nr:hypothetical protein [Syntrophobacterales bacterium]